MSRTPRTRRRAAGWTAALVVLAAATAACDIPVDRSAEALAGGVVVPALDPASREAPDADPGAGGEAQATMFLVKQDRLVEVSRTVPAAELRPALGLLLKGPTAIELESGIRTAIAPGTKLRGVARDAGTAVVDLSSAFVELGGQEQILAVAQFVLTATAVPGVTSVRFALDGSTVEVPRADGTLTPAPLTAADFTALRG